MGVLSVQSSPVGSPGQPLGGRFSGGRPFMAHASLTISCSIEDYPVSPPQVVGHALESHLRSVPLKTYVAHPTVAV